MIGELPKVFNEQTKAHSQHRHHHVKAVDDAALAIQVMIHAHTLR